MTTATYTVEGMTCGHCVDAVAGELAKLTGVSDVSVDLDRGTVKVTSADLLDPGTVRAAVHEAGYELRP